MIEPAKDAWITLFGSKEDKALKAYQEKKEKVRRDSIAQLATTWKDQQDARRDSIAQAEKRKKELDLMCIRQEMEKSKTDPCQSSLVFFSTYSSLGLPGLPELPELPTIPGILDNPPLDWLAASTKCNPDIKVPIQTYENGIFPFVLRQKEWIQWQFGVIGGRRITAQRLTRFFNLCK